MTPSLWVVICKFLTGCVCGVKTAFSLAVVPMLSILGSIGVSTVASLSLSTLFPWCSLEVYLLFPSISSECVSACSPGWVSFSVSPCLSFALSTCHYVGNLDFNNLYVRFKLFLLFSILKLIL